MAREQQLGQEIARLVEQHKDGPPIVYMRSFAAESPALFMHWTGETLPGYPMYWKDVGDVVVANLQVIGPALAIGRPGVEGFRYWSPVRIAKIPASDDEWQEVVSGWLGRAALVVVQLDATEGLQWELRQVVGFLRPTAVLLVLPPTQREYQKTCSSVGGIFPVALPPSLPKSRLLTFRADWEPLPLPRGPEGGVGFWYAVETVFEQNGFEPPPWRRIYGFGPRQ